MSKLKHLGWNQCSHGFTSRPLESCRRLCLKAVCGGLGTLKGHAFSPWSLPRVGNGDSKRKVVTPGHLRDAGSYIGKRVRLTRKTDPSKVVRDIPDPGHPMPRRWERLRLPSSEGVGV